MVQCGRLLRLDRITAVVTRQEETSQKCIRNEVLLHKLPSYPNPECRALLCRVYVACVCLQLLPQLDLVVKKKLWAIAAGTKCYPAAC